MWMVAWYHNKGTLAEHEIVEDHEKRPEPCKFTSGRSHGMVHYFSRGTKDPRLFFGAPRGETDAKLNVEISSGMTNGRTTSPSVLEQAETCKILSIGLKRPCPGVDLM